MEGVTSHMSRMYLGYAFEIALNQKSDFSSKYSVFIDFRSRRPVPSGDLGSSWGLLLSDWPI